VRLTIRTILVIVSGRQRAVEVGTLVLDREGSTTFPQVSERFPPDEAIERQQYCLSITTAAVGTRPCNVTA
jgi:hypothetical protein